MINRFAYLHDCRVGIAPSVLHRTILIEPDFGANGRRTQQIIQAFLIVGQTHAILLGMP